MSRIRTKLGRAAFQRRLTDGTMAMITPAWQEIDDRLITAGLRNHQGVEFAPSKPGTNWIPVEYTDTPPVAVEFAPADAEESTEEPSVFKPRRTKRE